MTLTRTLVSDLENRLDESLAPIGEIGLDRWIQKYDIELQKAAFISQLRLAKRKNVPVTIHCLRAWGMLLEILQEEGPLDAGFLLHSYGGPVEMVPRFLDIGAYFSISGYFASEDKKSKREALESYLWIDCWSRPIAPDMLGPGSVCPERLNNGANVPSNLIGIYEFASELLGMDSIEFRKIVGSNFLQLFGRWVK